MIIGVFGLPRQGKTTFLAKCAQMSLRGKSFMGIPSYDTVYTNFECRGCKKLDFNMLGKYNFHDCLILIDEIMLLADCRDFKNFSDDLKYFFSHHGHFNVTCLWCSQYYSDCDKKIRVLTDHFYLMQSSSWLPVTYIKPIIRSLEPRQGSMTDGYFLGAPYTWRLVYRPHWYKYFDSFTQRDLPSLPPVDFWEFPPEEDKKRFAFLKSKRSRKKSDTLSEPPECVVCPSENDGVIIPPTPLQAHTSKFEQTFEHKKSKLSAYGVQPKNGTLCRP